MLPLAAAAARMLPSGLNAGGLPKPRPSGTVKMAAGLSDDVFHRTRLPLVYLAPLTVSAARVVPSGLNAMPKMPSPSESGKVRIIFARATSHRYAEPFRSPTVSVPLRLYAMPYTPVLFGSRRRSAGVTGMRKPGEDADCRAVVAAGVEDECQGKATAAMTAKTSVMTATANAIFASDHSCFPRSQGRTVVPTSSARSMPHPRGQRHPQCHDLTILS